MLNEEKSSESMSSPEDSRVSRLERLFRRTRAHIGDIPVLEPGFSVTLTKDFVVGDEPVVNVGTAVGEDILGRVVSDDDDAFVSPIAGDNPPNPPNNPPTPFTGSDAGRLGLITMILAGIGVTVVASTRRRRSEREAA